MASTSGLVLAGYYLANENIKDLRYVQLSECLLYRGKGIKALHSVYQNNSSRILNLCVHIYSWKCFFDSYEKCGQRIADKIAENFSSACLVVVSTMIFFRILQCCLLAHRFITKHNRFRKSYQFIHEYIQPRLCKSVPTCLTFGSAWYRCERGDQLPVLRFFIFFFQVLRVILGIVY